MGLYMMGLAWSAGLLFPQKMLLCCFISPHRDILSEKRIYNLIFPVSKHILGDERRRMPMLCQLTFQNFKSYKNETTLDFQAASLPEFKESLITEESASDLLPVSVI